MGTSSIYNGPKDKNPLLPEGFGDEYEESMNTEEANENNEKGEEMEEIPSGSWQETKKAMSQYITGSSSNKGKVLRNYVKASGGARASAKQAVSGRRATIQLGRVLSSIASEGIIKTLEKLKIDYKGKSVQSLLSELVNEISSNSNTKEDIVARNATIQALSELYEYMDENNMDLYSLDNMNEEIFDAIMASFVSNYIFERMLNDLESRFEKYADNPLEAIEIERELEEYIKESVDIKLKEITFNRLDYNDSGINSIIEKTYKECYEVLEVYI
jgi:hypothetical protein